MSLKDKDNEKKDEINKGNLICPNAPKITKKPKMKKIPYINVIKDNDSYSSEEQNEKPINKAQQYKKDMDDRYNDDDSFDRSFNDEQETKSESGNIKEGKKKLKEDIPESISLK